MCRDMHPGNAARDAGGRLFGRLRRAFYVRIVHWQVVEEELASNPYDLVLVIEPPVANIDVQALCKRRGPDHAGIPRLAGLGAEVRIALIQHVIQALLAVRFEPGDVAARRIFGPAQVLHRVLVQVEKIRCMK